MRKIVQQRSQTQRFFLAIARFLERWWARYIFGPLVVSAPPALVLFFFRHQSVQQLAQSELPTGFNGFLIQHEPWVLLSAALYTALCTAAYGLVQHFATPKDPIDVDRVLALFESIEHVVGSKVDRFEAAVRQFHNGAVDPGKVFLQITKPDQQIALLGEALFSFFSHVSQSDVDLKLSIVELKDGKPIDWFYHTPKANPPRSSMSVLQRRESAVCRAASQKRMIVVENLQQELRKSRSDRCYAADQNGDVANGSLVSYPLLLGKSGTVPIVITVVADQVGYFQSAKKSYYDWIFKHFTVRMQMEWRLLELRRKAETGEPENHDEAKHQEL